MTTPMMRALAILSISSPVTINELSLYAVTEQSTMSRTLDALEAQGLVRRQRRPEDMRIRDVSITEDGRAAFERVWPMMHARFQTLFDGVDRGGISGLYRDAAPDSAQRREANGVTGAAARAGESDRSPLRRVTLDAADAGQFTNSRSV